MLLRLIILLCIPLLISSLSAYARKKSYRFKTAKEAKSNPKPTAVSATITETTPDSVTLRKLFPKGLIVTAENLKSEEKPIFTGFDKRLNASKESFFIINKSKSNIIGAVICLTYHTPDGRMLTRRYATINALIPAGETRNDVIPSSDAQRSFYYLKSETGKNGSTPTRGNPFDITLDPLAIILNK